MVSLFGYFQNLYNVITVMIDLTNVLIRVGMVGGKYQWLIMGTYSPTWWDEVLSPCPVQHLNAALDGCILTDYLPLSTTGEITVSGIVSMH